MHLVDITGLDSLLQLTSAAVGATPVRVISPSIIAGAGTAAAATTTATTVVVVDVVVVLATASVVKTQLLDRPSLRQRPFKFSQLPR